ncbi:hypothetical protein [Microbispora sp. NPDC049633]|uniref:hypothetical protein n=1 Tax=Microbispora sp. NPDC049633 TaxID=3154355 RepID=UPI00343FCCC0
METRLAALAVADVSSTLERRGAWSNQRRILAVVCGWHAGESLPALWVRITGTDPLGEPYDRATVEAAAREIGARIYRTVRSTVTTADVVATTARPRDLGLSDWWRVLDSQAGAVWWLRAPGACRARVRDKVASYYPGDLSHGRRVALTARPGSYH